ncbi:MAG: tetratricopeptide repeat protein, partial [Planctomycetota bacterium]
MATALGGCQITAHKRQREEAQKHWSQVRASVKHQLATQQAEAGQIEAAISTVREALGLDPTALESYLLLSRALLEKGDLQAARRALVAAETVYAEMSPELQDRDPVVWADLYYLRGVIAERSRQHADALNCYTRARQLGPDQKDFLVAQAECLVALGRPEEARQQIWQSIDHFECDGTLETLVAEISLVLGDQDSAVAAFQRAMPLVGEDDLVAEEYGLLLFRMGRLAEAISVLQPLWERTGTDASGSVVRTLAECFLDVGRSGMADDLLDKWLNKHPNDVLGWMLGVRAAAARGDEVMTRRCADVVRRLAPQDPRAYLVHGYVCWRFGDLDGAVASLERSLALDPDDALAHCLMGQA